MALGMSGHADGHDTVRLEQAGLDQFGRLRERTLRFRRISRDGETAFDISLLDHAFDHGPELVLGPEPARGEMRHGFEAESADFMRRSQPCLERLAGQERHRDRRILGDLRGRLAEPVNVLGGDLEGEALGDVLRFAVPVGMDLCIAHDLTHSVPKESGRPGEPRTPRVRPTPSV